MLGVLSGFVIHFSYLNAASTKFDGRGFFARRFWRLYPSYLLALLIFSIFRHYSFTEDTRQFFMHAVFAHNLRPNFFFGINASFWSLAVEVQFYLLYPLLLFIRSKVGILGALRLTLALGIALRLVLLCFTDCAYPISALWAATPIVWFDWVLGAYVAESFHKGKRAFNVPTAVVYLLPVLFVLSSLFKPTNAFSFSVASLACAVFIDKYIERRDGTDLGAVPRPLHLWERALVPLGLCSYSLYLWHQPVLQYLINENHKLHLSITSIPAFGIALIALFALLFGWSWLLYLAVEKSSMLLGKTFLKKRLAAKIPVERI